MCTLFQRDSLQIPTHPAKKKLKNEQIVELTQKFKTTTNPRFVFENSSFGRESWNILEQKVRNSPGIWYRSCSHIGWAKNRVFGEKFAINSTMDLSVRNFLDSKNIGVCFLFIVFARKLLLCVVLWFVWWFCSDACTSFMSLRCRECIWVFPIFHILKRLNYPFWEFCSLPLHLFRLQTAFAVDISCTFVTYRPHCSISNFLPLTSPLSWAAGSYFLSIRFPPYSACCLLRLRIYLTNSLSLTWATMFSGNLHSSWDILNCSSKWSEFFRSFCPFHCYLFPSFTLLSTIFRIGFPSPRFRGRFYRVKVLGWA